MNFERFQRLLDVYRDHLTARQVAVLEACARRADSVDAYVDLIVLMQTIAHPQTRRADIRERVQRLTHRPYGNDLALLN
jgi:hypothetical protein